MKRIWPSIIGEIDGILFDFWYRVCNDWDDSSTVRNKDKGFQSKKQWSGNPSGNVSDHQTQKTNKQINIEREGNPADIPFRPIKIGKIKKKQNEFLFVKC